MQRRAALLRFKFEDFVWENKAVQCTNGEAMCNANFAHKAVQLRKYCRPVSQTWETPNMEHAVHYDTSYTTDNSQFKVCSRLEDASQLCTGTRFQLLKIIHTFHLSNNLNSSQRPSTVTIDSITCLRLQ